MDLQELMDKIVERWKFDKETYPALKTIVQGSIPWQLFAVDHILHHQAKSCGVLSGVIESSQHGRGHGLYEQNTNPMEYRIQMRTAAVKMVKNALRLAEVLGLNAENIEQMC